MARVFRCWEPGGRTEVVRARTVHEAAREFLQVKHVEWVNGTAPHQGVTYVAWGARRVCKVWEQTQATEVTACG